MRTRFAIICLGVAGIGVDADPSGSACSLPFGGFECPTKRHLRIHEPRHVNEEERSGVKRAREEVDALLDAPSSSVESRPMLKRLKTFFEDHTVTDKLSAMLELRETASMDTVKSILDFGKIYVDFHHVMVSNSQATLLQTLRAQYGDEGVAKIIAIAKKNEATALIATRLQWLRDYKPGDILSAMKRAKPDRNFVEHRTMSNWYQYVDDFNNEYPEKKKSRRAWLKDQDKNLAKRVFGDRKYALSSSTVRKKLDDLFESWLDVRCDPAIVFAFLGLCDEKIKFESDSFTVWMNYVASFNSEKPLGEKDVWYFSVLEPIYDVGELANMICNELLTRRTKRVALEFLIYLEKEVPNGKDTEMYKRVRVLKNSIKKIVGSTGIPRIITKPSV